MIIELSNVSAGQNMLFVGGYASNLHKKPFLITDLTTSNGNTGHVGFVFHKQPELEKAMRDAASGCSSSELRTGCTVQSISEDTERVEVHYVDSQGRKRQLCAPFLVGADGKTGFVRKKYLEPKGIQLDRCEGFVLPSPMRKSNCD